MNCRAEFSLTELTPPVVNRGPAVDAVLRALEKTLPEAILEPNCRTMVSEDMAFIQEKVPGCYFLVGSANPDKDLAYAHHHPKFDIDEDALPGAVALMTGSVFELLGD
jgi:amidohydrolase